MQQNQLLTNEGALKMAGISSAVLMKAINEGVVKLQLATNTSFLLVTNCST